VVECCVPGQPAVNFSDLVTWSIDGLVGTLTNVRLTANVFLRPLYELYDQQQLVTGSENRCAVDSDIDLLS